MVNSVRKNKLAPVFFLMILGLSSCTASSVRDSQGMRTVTIAAWNVQALFDGTETGNEYGEYTASSGWSKEKYLARLTFLSQGVDLISADILAMIEVENPQILETLSSDLLAKQKYHWNFFANNPGASLGIGVLSRFPFIRTKTHSAVYGEETTPRPVLEVWLEPAGRPLVLFICHWKSKLGGDKNTEPLRRASARIINRRMEEIRQEYPEIPVIILGDLNENHDEFYRQKGAYVSALLPDDPGAAEAAGKIPAGVRARDDFLIISGEKPPRAEHFPRGSRAFYSPWEIELSPGSYYYQDTWETIDHLLLSEALFDNSGWDFDSCQAVAQEPFLNAQGYPNAYNPRTGFGLSDHLPLKLVLRQSSPGVPAD
ncbi:MAG: endonuclease/exonuclease/phosphatase family protein [Spirochaetaceae bacterium]|jgi:endonuclease/exonuclease/phosphatase family metal-dependent hydrolase|nr:endonuclease/exonuclease/phosphatase family protein [Spirochaetaceae bacterium]